MKDDIKEILEALKPHDEEFIKAGIKEYPLELSIKEQKILLDYITNLQQYYNDNVNKYEELIEKYSNLQQENERLNNGFCELKVKCNNGEIDCTNEEYDGMVQANMKGALLLEDYKSRCEKAVEIINKYELIVGYYDYADEDGYWDTYKNNNLQEELKDTLNGRSDE